MMDTTNARQMEGVLLGTVILHGEYAADVFGVARCADFLVYGKLAALLYQMHSDGIPVDFLSVQARANGLAEAVETVLEQAQRDEVVATPMRMREYARLVYDEAKRWRKADALAKGMERLKAAKDVDAETARIIAALTEDSRETGKFESADTVGGRYLDFVIDRLAIPEQTWGVPTGFEDMDAVLGGLEKDSLYVIAGRPSMGKTAFGLALANGAVSAGIPAAFFTLEMSADQMFQRFVCMRGGFNSYNIRRGLIDDQPWTYTQKERLFDAIKEARALPLYINGQAAITTAEARAQAGELVRSHGIGLAVFDYVNLAGDKGENRNIEVGAVGRGLKEMAKQHHIPVVALAQLNRGLEKRDSKEPQLSDLRDSGELEQVANVVIFLHREDYYHRNDPTYQPDKICKCIVAKNQSGAVGYFDLLFDETFTRFETIGGKCVRSNDPRINNYANNE